MQWEELTSQINNNNMTNNNSNTRYDSSMQVYHIINDSTKLLLEMIENRKISVHTGTGHSIESVVALVFMFVMFINIFMESFVKFVS